MNKLDNKQLLLELAIFLNKELLKDNQINYQTFKSTEDYILKQIRK